MTGQGASPKVATTAKKQERVIVRFAGDSGDGMQLVGDRFTAATALRRQRPLDAARLPGRDPRPGRNAARRLRLPDPLRLARHPHPRRLPEHAGGDEPGGARSPPRRTRVGRDADRQRGRLHRKPTCARPATRPTRSTTARSTEYQVFRVPMTTLTTRATEDIEGLKPAEAQRTKNVFALGLISWMYGRPTESTISWLETKFAKTPGDPRRPTSPPSRPATTSARRPRSPRPRSRSSRRRSSRASTATSTAPRRWRWG